ncbi:MAG TPA: site-specific integrase [Flavisolibacter sp.]|jgi:integrase|nr:site-specific integrase [Flavisolibacter sp.]
MPNVNFYLKKAEESTGRSLIKLRFKYGKNDLVFTFGQTVLPSHWNPGKQRVKSNKETTADGEHSLNDLLDALERVLLKAYKAEIKNGIPDPALLKMKLINYINRQDEEQQQSDFFALADRFIKGEIKHDGRNKSKNTTKTYQTVVGHLKAFELAKRYPISFDTITLDFYDKYISYLNSIPLAQNTIAKHVQVIKVFMNEALDRGYTANVQHKKKKFKAKWIETDAVYLTDAELTRLFKHDFSENKKLEQVRDLFIFGCYVGLRFSDYSNVKKENLITIDGEKFIRINTKKTGEQVMIPCNPVVLQIFDKYQRNPNQLPKSLSNQKFNDYIKDALKATEMNEKGRLLTDPEKELWQCVSSHTARRSFATNLYLEGYPTLEIMKITGHKTEKSFLKYIRVTKLDAAKKLSAHMKKRWSEKLLKVAS